MSDIKEGMPLFDGIPELSIVPQSTFYYSEIMRNIPIAEVSIEDSPMYQQIKESAEYQKKSYEVLKAIEENTANLRVLVDLVHNSKENQDEIIALLSEIQIMAKAKDSEEAASLYKRVMAKIAGVVKDAETIQKLSSYAGTVFTIVQTFFPKDGV